MGISGNMQSLSQLCACYGVPRVTQGFITLFIGETFAVYHIGSFKYCLGRQLNVTYCKKKHRKKNRLRDRSNMWLKSLIRILHF